MYLLSFSLRSIEDYNDYDVAKDEVEWELDENTRKHWEAIGLMDSGSLDLDDNSIIAYND